MAGAPWDDFAEVDDKPTQEAGPWQDYAPKADSSRPSGPWDDYKTASSRPGFLSTIGQAGLKGLKEGVSETADVADPFKDRPQAPDTSYIGKILEKPVSEGWNDPNWWAAHIAYGGAKSAPSLAAGAAGAFAGSTAGPVGTLAGGAAGFGLGSVIQTLAPAYQRARQDGLEHDDAVTRAMEQAGISGAFGAAMGLAPGAAVLGRTAEGALKRPISEALAQIFGVQPAIGAGQQVATGATEGRMPTAGELATGYAENVGLGTAVTGAHAGLRRLTAAEAPGLAADEHPVPPGGAQTAPEGAPESVPRDHQVGYDLETNTFKVVGPEGETVKTGFENDALAEAEARKMDGVKAEEVPSERPVPVEHAAEDSERPETEAPPETDGGRDIAEPPVAEAAERVNVNEEHQLNESPRDWADIAVPLAAKEVGADLTPWQHHQALALVRNGMDSTEAVRRVNLPNAHEEAARLVVARGKDTGTEHLSVVDENAGRLSHFIEGKKTGEIVPTDELAAALADQENRLSIHHNHPSGGALSIADKKTLANAGQSWVIAHTHDGGMAGARLSAPTAAHLREQGPVVSAFAMERLGRVATNAIISPLEEMVAAKRLNETDANRIAHEIANRAMDAAGLIDYVSTHDHGPLNDAAYNRFLTRATEAVQREAHSRNIPTEKRDDLSKRAWAVRRDRGMEEISRQASGDAEKRPGGTERDTDRAMDARPEAKPEGGVDEIPSPYKAPERLIAERNSVAPEGRNSMDATSDAIAEAVGGKGAGTYDRAMDRLRPKAGSELKNLNPVENFTIFPDTLAKTDKMFARLWNAWKGRERAEHTHITGWRELIPELRNAKRGDPDVQKAYAAIELHAINREKAMPGEKVRVRNVDTKKATKSKPGEDYTLTPRQEKIYHELNALHDAEWDTMMKATAEKYGWKGAPTAAALANAARGATKSEARQLGRLAELLHMMAQQKQQVYFPRSRFGDTFISVKPKAGQEKDSLGGFPELSHFETVERPWSQDVLGKSGRPDVSRRIAELRKEYPAATHEIETGLLQKRPDMLRRLDIPAVEKLLALTEQKARQITSAKMKAREGLTADEAKAMAKEEHAAFKDDMLDTLRDVMYQEMKSGFKKKARIVPGYSPDFDRAIGTHMHQMARHAADLAHREGIDRAYQDIQDKHEHETTKKWVRDWRQFQDDPNTPLGRAANGASQIGYVWTLAMNPSSTLVNLFDIPQSAIPSLAVGNGLRASLAHMGPALAEAYRHTTFNLKQGAHIALEKLGRTPDERAFIQALKNDGSIHSVSVDDMRELGGRQAEAYGEIKSTMRRAMDIATSNMSVMDQANRAAVALSFYRMAKDPARLQKMAEAWGGNQKFRDAVEYNGLNPETMARFGLSEAAYEWGRSNKARVMRGPLGTAMFTLHGYQTRFLSNAMKLMKNMGPSGKIAAGWMMAGIWAGAGIEGLPFAQDMENLGDVVWKTLTKHDPMIAYRLRDGLAQAGLGKIGAEIVMRGPLSTLTGTDVSNRIGFGDVLSREWSGITSGTDVLGTVPSIMFGRLAAAWRREQSRQGHAAAAAELLPAALRNPARAVIEADQGLKTQNGKLVAPASRIGPADLTKIGMGFRPLEQERAYEHKDYGYRAKRAHGTVPHDAIPRSGE